MTEQEFLNRQESQARRALHAASTGIGAGLRDSLGVDRVMRRHPVLILGAGAATGFLVGRFAAPQLQRSAAAATRFAARMAGRGTLGLVRKLARQVMTGVLAGEST